MNEKKILTSNEDAVRLTTRDDIDWDVVAEQIFSIYEMAIVGGKGVSLSSDGRAWGRFLSWDEEKK